MSYLLGATLFSITPCFVCVCAQCVLLQKNVFSYNRMCSLTIECVQYYSLLCVCVCARARACNVIAHTFCFLWLKSDTSHTERVGSHTYRMISHTYLYHILIELYHIQTWRVILLCCTAMILSLGHIRDIWRHIWGIWDFNKELYCFVVLRW